MEEKITEKANSPKVREQIRKDGRKATEQAIERVANDLASRGFDRAEVLPIVKEGVRDASYSS